MSRRLLIVSPAFHGYVHAIRRAFEQLGYSVATHCYDRSRGVGEKIWNKARWELPSHLGHGGEHLSGERASRRALDAVRAIRPELLLVIRGDVLDESFWAGATALGARPAVWLYDEIRRTAFDPTLVARFAPIASYSAADARSLERQGAESLHVPLGFDATIPAGPRGAAGQGRVSFIGATSTGRQRALHALLAAGVPVQAWGRGWSTHPADRARTWRVRGYGIPSGRDVPGEQAHAIMRDSAATLNVHGDQDGFTMRTFEACGAGAVQLIDRADVVDFYQPGGELCVFADHEELIDLARRALCRPEDFDQLRQRARDRTLAEHTLVHRARVLERLWRL